MYNTCILQFPNLFIFMGVSCFHFLIVVDSAVKSMEKGQMALEHTNFNFSGYVLKEG